MIFGKKEKVSEPPVSYDELLTRGIENIYPSRDFLESKLKRGEKVSLYLGIDPTGPTLHLGHAIILQKLKQFQDLGHKVILLIGDFTGMIGDPTDKTATRKMLTHDQVLANASLYKKQASRFLSFSGRNKAEIKYNSDWLASMTFADVINLMSKMTVDQMLKRDMFDKRMSEGKPIHLHEFMYPLMQGYDSVAMNVDGEIGGNDQMFNMLAGRTLMKEMLNKEKFVLTVKLLADQQGKKMGKSEGNMIAMTDSSQDMYGKVMSWTDGMILSGFELCTTVSLNEISEIKKQLEAGANPRDVKMRLAREITSTYHGADAAQKAEENFVNTFKKGGVPDDAQTLTLKKGSMLIDAVLEAKLVASKTEWKRLIDEGAVFHLDSQKKIADMRAEAWPGAYKIGKRRFIRINIV